MHSYQHSRGRILFEVACAFGISASCVWAWMQTYSSAMLPVAGIVALYGLVHAFDLFRRRPPVIESVEVFQPAASFDPGESLPMAAPPVFAEPAADVVVEPAPKRKRKASRKAETSTLQDESDTKPWVAPAEPDPQLETADAVKAREPEAVEAVEVTDPEVVEPQPAMRVVDTAPEAPEYYPATPLFEAEPFVRQQRAAFGRKAR